MPDKFKSLISSVGQSDALVMRRSGVRIPYSAHTKINIMKIKLKRSLWNKKSGEEMEVNSDMANWAVNKGYAEAIEDENKAIVPEYKNKAGRPKAHKNAN